MSLNITCNLLESEIVGIVNKVLVIPQLILLYLTSMVLFLAIGLLMIDGSRGDSPYSKFILIWIVSVILIGIVVLFMIYSPNVIFSFLSKISEFWS